MNTPQLFPALVASTWAYPFLEIVHIVGIALLLGNLVLLELRLFGMSDSIDIVALGKLTLLLLLLGLGLIALSGILMFAARPLELISSRIFTLKILLILLAGGNAIWFQSRGSLRRQDTTAKVQILFSTVLWLAVITCGRLIAYL